MGKLDPVGEGGEESGSIVGGWGGQLLWEAYVPGIWYEAKIEFIHSFNFYLFSEY